MVKFHWAFLVIWYDKLKTYLDYHNTYDCQTWLVMYNEKPPSVKSQELLITCSSKVMGEITLRYYKTLATKPCGLGIYGEELPSLKPQDSTWHGSPQGFWLLSLYYHKAITCGKMIGDFTHKVKSNNLQPHGLLRSHDKSKGFISTVTMPNTIKGSRVVT